MINVRFEFIIEQITITLLEHDAVQLIIHHIFKAKTFRDYLPFFCDLRFKKNHVLCKHVIWHLDQPLKPLQIQHNTDTIRIVGCKLHSWAEASEVFDHSPFWFARKRQALLSLPIIKQSKVAILNDQLLGTSKDHCRVKVLLFKILELHLLLVFYIKLNSSRPYDLIVLIEKSSFEESWVADRSASHLDVEAPI